VPGARFRGLELREVTYQSPIDIEADGVVYAESDAFPSPRTSGA
jgi:hypothetical protein